MTLNVSGKTALVVMSNDHMRRLLKSILNAMGFSNVLTCARATDALPLLKEDTLSVVLCGGKLEDAEGTDLVQVVRADTDVKISGLPVILFTERPTPELADKARAAKASALMTLPSSLSALTKALEALRKNAV